MASQTRSNPSTLELTEEETKLRNLLLAVATYIDDGSSAEATTTAVSVPEEVAQEKIVLRWTGGWVRDKLLGVGSHDVDVAINKMTGENFGLKMLEYLKIPGNLEKHAFDTAESGKIMSGLHTIKANPEASKNLETATIKVMGIDLDLVNLRKETYDEVSRNPQMEFGTAEEDAMRRDATVNAMFYNLHTQQIEDFTKQGFEDMDAKIIRTPLEPYQTFKDDPLRVLRLIRFASRLNYRIDGATELAMKNEEIREILKIKISRERVGIELEKMLRGPDPLMALSLIDRLGLYDTIFTDPTRNIKSTPDIAYFRSAYNFMNEILSNESAAIPDTIARTLAQTPDEKYLAWICATVMPWTDAPTIPHEKKTRAPYYAAYLVAREGFKAPNKVSDIIAASLHNGESIRQLVDNCTTQLRRSTTNTAGEDATAPDTLGMAIRRWGPTWRTQVLFNLIYEVVLENISRDRKSTMLTLPTCLLIPHRSSPIILRLSHPHQQAQPPRSLHLQASSHRHRARQSPEH